MTVVAGDDGGFEIGWSRGAAAWRGDASFGVAVKVSLGGAGEGLQ
jgi:hypothetical protein